MSEVNVGDRVVIRAVRNASLHGRLVGRTGKVVYAFQTHALQGHYTVETESPQERAIATSVEKVDDVVRPTDLPLAAWERALYAAENHDWRDEEAAVEKLHRYGIIDDETLSHELRRVNDERSRTAPDKKRTQAMEFARRILGADADLDELLRLAEWALNEPELEAAKPDLAVTAWLANAAWEKAKKDDTRAAGLGPVAATIDEVTPTAPRPPAGLQIIDRDGDGIGFHYNGDLPDVVALVDVYDEDGGSHNAFIRPADADRIIAFLQAAKAAKA